jgi:D-alanyl-D-alanine carboxypeptidase
MRNHNSLIGRYEGADGMKTGFICASGFNLVASATRRGKRLIAVVLGSQSSPYRGAKAAGLLERGFNRGALSWLSPSLGTVESLQPVNAAPPDLRDELCGKHRKRPAAEEADDENGNGADSPLGFLQTSLPAGSNRASALIGPPPAALNTIVVHAGPSKKPAETQFAATRALLARAATRSAKVATAGKADVVPVAAAAAPALAPASDALKRDPHTAPVPAAAPPAPLAPAQTASVQSPTPPAGTFAPPPHRFERSARALPGATDVGHPSWMSFAPAARAETPPLTATPDAKPAPAAAKPAAVQVVAVPVPRPRPKLAAKPETRRKPAAAAAR